MQTIYNNQFQQLVQSITMAHSNNVDQSTHHYAFLIPNHANTTSHRKCISRFQ